MGVVVLAGTAGVLSVAGWALCDWALGFALGAWCIDRWWGGDDRGR